ncbi:hypothetical protein NHJ13734_009391 [Beauveria thailandica]
MATTLLPVPPNPSETASVAKTMVGTNSAFNSSLHTSIGRCDISNLVTEAETRQGILFSGSPGSADAVPNTNVASGRVPTSAPSASALRITPDDADADAMTGEVGDSSTSAKFFGSSSAVSFMRQINAAIDTLLDGSHTSAPSQNNDPLPRTRPTTARNEPMLDPLAYTLPARNFADALIADYYASVWAILPVHDWTIFKQAYTDMWLGKSSERISESELYCMTNLSFALGSQFSQNIPPQQRRELGQTFWRRAETIFDSHLRSAPSMEGVQCLLMMGLFLQGASDSHRCWMTVGSAIRMAQSLGLYSSSSANTNGSFREIEIGRRVWHGCVFMDRSVLSMTFGRPSMIANWLSDAVPLPLMIDDEFLDTQRQATASRPDGETSRVGFFIFSLELYSIVNDFLLELYMDPLGRAVKAKTSLGTVIGYDDRLEKWLNSIPEFLRWSSQSPVDDFILQRQRIVLRARYLHARITLLRPIVAEFYLKQPKSDDSSIHPDANRCLSQTLVERCSALCFEAAREIISMIYANLNLETLIGPVPAWWFTVLFVYSAATALLAERFGPTGSGPRSGQSWSSASTWDQAMQLLKAYARVGESAERCVAALEILSAKFQSHASDRQPQHAKDQVSTTRRESALDVAQPMHQELPDIAAFPTDFDLNAIDLDISDMMWLNATVGDIIF